MVTRTEQRLAGLAALATAAALVTALVLFDGGPPTHHGGVITSWFADHTVAVKGGAIAWMLATIAIVVFAVAVREALWATVIEHGWAALLFVQGAVVFAAVSVVSGALAWALADQAAVGTLTPDVAVSVWGVARTLLRFASWGLTVPVMVVGLVLYRYSTLGQFAAVIGVIVAGALVVPVTWEPALFALAGWLVLTGVVFLQPFRRHQRVPSNELVDGYDRT